MADRTNREIVDSFYEAAGEKAVAGEPVSKEDAIDHMRRIFAEDIEWIHPAMGGAFHGVESVIKNVVIPFFDSDDYEGFGVDIESYVEEGSTIVVLANYRGLYKPTGKSFAEPTAHAFDLNGGKIVRFRQYVNVASLQAQLEEEPETSETSSP